MSIESKLAERRRREQEEAERRSRKKGRLKLWHVVLICMPLVFAVFFLIGYYGSGSEESRGPAPGFTVSDRAQMAARIQEDYDEPIMYLTSVVDEEKTAASGIRFYEITYIVTSEHSEDVYLYVFYKVMNTVGEHSAGSLELILRTVTDQYEKGDILEESYEIHDPEEEASLTPDEPTEE